MGPWSIIGDVIVGWISVEKKEKRIQLWLVLLFQMGMSALISFLFMMGTVLVSTKSFALGVGAGLISAAVVLSVFVRRSPLTKGMMFVLPVEEAKTEIDTNVQIIQK